MILGKFVLILDKLKFKNLTLDELIISLDRLSRFKLPEISYKRVIFSVISKKLIIPKYSVSELDNLSADDLVRLFEIIWNTSVFAIFGKKYKQMSSKSLEYLSKVTFKNLDEETKIFIKAKIILEPILKSIDYKSAPCNLKYLIKTYNAKNYSEILSIIKKYKLKFPIKKLLIVEGITEEILLPVFAYKLGMNFDDLGIFILGAGGKSKSPSIYIELKDKLNIPVVLLFDKDAVEIAEQLKKIILPKDKILLLQQGEFEDILSLNLIKRTLNNEYQPVTKLSFSELQQSNRMTVNIEEFYKRRHLGEFKKSKFSKMVSMNIRYRTDISDEIKTLIEQVIS